MRIAVVLHDGFFIFVIDYCEDNPYHYFGYRLRKEGDEVERAEKCAYSEIYEKERKERFEGKHLFALHHFCTSFKGFKNRNFGVIRKEVYRCGKCEPYGKNEDEYSYRINQRRDDKESPPFKRSLGFSKGSKKLLSGIGSRGMCLEIRR